MHTFKNRSIAAFGALVATFATVAASSPARAEERTAHVTYADLDLRSTDGAATLDRRINAATGRVCRSSDAMMHRAVAQCRREAAARVQANLPTSEPTVQIAAR